MRRYSQSFLYLIHLTTVTGLAYADVTYTDSDFASPITTGIESNSVVGNVTINTSSASNPQVNNSGFALNVIDRKTLTINNASDFKADGLFGIRAVNNTGSGISTVLLNGPGDITLNAGDRGFLLVGIVL